MTMSNMPTLAERARHELDHKARAACCRSCVAGQGKADGHVMRSSDDSDTGSQAIHERCLLVFAH